MRKKSKLAVTFKVLGIVMMILGIVLSIILGVTYSTSVQEFFYTQQYFNWQVMLAGVWLSVIAGFILFGMGSLLQKFSEIQNQLKVQTMENQCVDELPRI